MVEELVNTRTYEYNSAGKRLVDGKVNRAISYINGYNINKGKYPAVAYINDNSYDGSYYFIENETVEDKIIRKYLPNCVKIFYRNKFKFDYDLIYDDYNAKIKILLNFKTSL